MKALIAVITIYDFIFLAYIGGETYFAICLKRMGKLRFGNNKVFEGCLEELFLLSHVFLLVLLNPHSLKGLGQHFLVFVSKSVFEINKIMLPHEKPVDMVDVLVKMVSLFYFLKHG